MHRDLKLENILIHFPGHPELEGMKRAQKDEFLMRVDLLATDFVVKIADFGLAK